MVLFFDIIEQAVRGCRILESTVDATSKSKGFGVLSCLATTGSSSVFDFFTTLVLLILLVDYSCHSLDQNCGVVI